MTNSTHSRRPPIRYLAAVLFVCASACSASADDDFREGELMFDLDEDEVVRIHDLYVPMDDLELTRERLTAPFDCSLFGDFCAQVGRDAAIEITGRQIELARAGASVEEMSEQTLAWVTEAMDEYEPEDEDADDSEGFRANGPWSTQTIGDYRLRVRHGITVPMAGDREAWTRSKFQHQDWLGIWWQVQADILCVDTGPNTMELNNSGIWQTIGTKDKNQICYYDDGNLKQITTHSRLSSPGALDYRLTVRGCGSAENNGVNFQRCPADYFETF